MNGLDPTAAANDDIDDYGVVL